MGQKIGRKFPPKLPAYYKLSVTADYCFLPATINRD